MNCNNYCGISLLIIVGKTFAWVILIILQKLAERVYPEALCGFRRARSTIDMLFSLRQLQEKCSEQQVPLYIAFIDLTKAFDLISRSSLFQLLEKIGCPPKLLNGMLGFKCTRCVSSASCCTAVRHGRHMPGASPQHYSPTLPQAHPWHQMAGSHPQHRSAQAGKHFQQLCSPAIMARPRVSHGGRPNPKRHPLQWA